ncbi:MAG: fumarate hydratase [Clostridia bacterium]|nr:fumarate hydratase [Clostridia bacterium]
MVLVNSEIITKTVKRLFIESAFYIPEDILNALKDAKEKETEELPKSVLDNLILNHKIAREEHIPICQDTGMAVVFIELGKDVTIKGQNIYDAVNQGVSQAYKEGYLRKSVVSDPLFDRKNTSDNTPAVIYTDIVDGEKIKITVGAKGFGSENMSAIKMMNPTQTVQEVEDFIVSVVENAGSKPCPPVIVGVGIGGTFDKAAVLSKKALLRPIDEENEDKRYAEMEKRLLKRINSLKIGPAGIGGNTTALAVNINTYPTHIAGLPVAVNICCHAARGKQAII